MRTASITLLINLVIAFIGPNRPAAQPPTAPLVVRVAVFAPDQGSPDDYRGFIDGHLFPALRTVHGYVGTFIGRDPADGQTISISFWHSAAEAAAGEEAVGKVIRALPAGSAPKPSNVRRYEVKYRDLHGTFDMQDR